MKHFFETHPIFRYEEYVGFMTDQGVLRPQSWRQQLSYHKKVGHLIHIRKFLYAVKPMLSEVPWIDPYLLASKMTSDAILGYHTALELHGIAYTTFNEFSVLSYRQASPFVYEGQRFRAIIQPAALVKRSNTNFGVTEIKRSGLIIKLTSLERSIVDVLDRPDLGGGWEEIWRSFDHITHLEIDKVVEYALLLKNATTIAKVGYFLEQLPSYLAIDQKHIERLVHHIPRQPHYMNRTRQKEGKYIEKWNLIVPLEIINRTWEEPDVENI